MTFDIAEEKRKRHRRTATEIARHYKCPVEVHFRFKPHSPDTVEGVFIRSH